MLKNTDRYKRENETHFTNTELKKKRKKVSSYRDITIFISVFLIGLLIILGFAKILSPNVDVEIAGNDEFADFEDEGVLGTVDERLKHLQLEDENGGIDDKMFSPELDEKVVLPTKPEKISAESETEVQNPKTQEEKAPDPHASAVSANTEKKPETAQPAQPSHNVSYRVVVGQYSSDKQAEVAKSIIQDSGAGVSPIIKNIGGTYTLQVGVFSSKEKAQQVANNLLKNNFPARVIE